MFQIFSIVSLVIAITIHEFSHAFVADILGDPTPRSQKRLSLNPLKHLDPLGTIMLILVGFGWGKPVVIDPYNFSHPRRDEIFVSLSGPLSNILLAIVMSIFLKLFPFTPLVILIQMNIILAVFNLLPIPPLDGSKIFLNLLPEQKSYEWELAFEKYGIIILIALLFLPFNGSNLISSIMSPIIQFVLQLLV